MIVAPFYVFEKGKTVFILCASSYRKITLLSGLLFLIGASICADVIGFYEQRDLELIASFNQSHGGVFTHLDQTQTIFGKQRLAYHLTHPINSLEVLEKRQAVIYALQTDKKLAESVTGLLKQIKENQYGLEYFLKPHDDVVDKHIIENYYFSCDFLKGGNASTAALSVRDAAKKIGLFAPVVEHLFMHAFLHILTSDHDHAHCGGHWWDFLKPSKEVGYVLNALHLGVFANSIYEMVQHIQAQTAVLNHVYTNIAAARVCFTSMHELYHLMNNHDVLSAACEKTDFFESAHNKQLTELMALFEDDYFATDDSLSFFSSVGTTLRANIVLKEHLANWKHALDTIGDLDVYVSMARLVDHHQSKVGKFSFVRFIKDVEQPYVCMKCLWNLMLDADTVVTNDVVLGTDQPSFMVITGPNKAGKSSILRALGLNIVLAQAFGIACASDVEMTIFDKLLTYMMITDDISQDMSLMVAEMARADACVKIVQNLQPGQHACCLIDDSLFKGTTFQSGQDMAYKFVQTLGNFKHNCGMIATHTALLTQLETDASLLFKNYCIATQTIAQGNVVSTFLLQPGISSPEHVLAIVQPR